MAELADALALGASGRKAVQVQVLFSAPASFLLFSSVNFPIAFSRGQEWDARTFGRSQCCCVQRVALL